ncbi:HAMP domain-containing sensor histidine kinase [Niveispirillum sp.]|uniref:sensor histidine kinase n=1 Tax=Niveispirillum sp. TaxID=1917217 RepID=UPI001B5C5036|nr:HAMP domain-containing sensor histidine kinase [Niveispirillum sp.]MBP7340599.1 HAMP domain-containing histidine kinase [Niveispirillum sp.]
MTAPAPLDPVRLLSSVGHDLRQPFQAMRLFLNLLQMKLADPKQVELADRLEQALEIGAAQMDQVLTLAALAAGSARVRLEQVPLAPLLSRVTGELSDKAADAGMEIRLVPSTLVVDSDPVMLDRVLRALIENAIAHAAPGRRILVGVRRAGGPALIVADDGPGIDPAHRDGVMEAGGRVEKGGTGRRGLGLGLTLCQHIAHRLDHGFALGGRSGLTATLRFGGV